MARGARACAVGPAGRLGASEILGGARGAPRARVCGNVTGPGLRYYHMQTPHLGPTPPRGGALAHCVGAEDSVANIFVVLWLRRATQLSNKQRGE